jgi:hypothetical protein
MIKKRSAHRLRGGHSISKEYADEELAMAVRRETDIAYMQAAGRLR